ncbi:hypothetical protein KIPB_000053, partial [Kipferlia bialata]|eukprot:g53.t1
MGVDALFCVRDIPSTGDRVFLSTGNWAALWKAQLLSATTLTNLHPALHPVLKECTVVVCPGLRARIHAMPRERIAASFRALAGMCRRL